jgi:16S rRNA G966 N2-methylase RsmD
MNRLYFGDNLKWLSDQKEFPDAGVDLVYLDPPFNSNADYNVLFRRAERRCRRGSTAGMVLLLNCVQLLYVECLRK